MYNGSVLENWVKCFSGGAYVVGMWVKLYGSGICCKLVSPHGFIEYSVFTSEHMF